MSAPSRLLLKVFAENDPVIDYELSNGVDALEVIIKLHLLSSRPTLKFSEELLIGAKSQLDISDIESLNGRVEGALSLSQYPSEIVETLLLLRNELWGISMALSRQLRSNHFSSSLNQILNLESISLTRDLEVIPDRAMDKLKHLDAKARSSLFAIQQILIICQYAEKMHHRVSLFWLN